MKTYIRIRRTWLIATVLIFCTAITEGQNHSIYHKEWIDFNKNGKKDIYEDPEQKIDVRIQDLLQQMTVDEKTCQCATLYGYKRVLDDELPTPEWKNEIWKDGIANIDEQLNGLRETQYSYPYSKHAEAINTIQRWFVEETRLGIPVDFSNEGIHGLNHDRATPLPAPIAIGSTWNKTLARQAGEIVGREGKALGYTNIYAPILDLARDPRWGRVLECYGEDPYHVASLGQQMVEGIQSQGVASTLKHYAVYSVPKGARDGNTRTDPHVAPREMHQLHLYPYRKIVSESQPKGVMSSYNDWDGVPVSASYYFLTELLRQQYGFTGYVVSDSEAVEFVHSKHRVAPDYKDAVRQVAEAGLNVRTHFTPPEDYILPLRELVKEGKLSMKTLDRNVADVLRVKFQLGLFDAPYVKNPMAADSIVAAPESEEFVLQMARESLVLLKNENNLLPLNLSALKNILVTGPLADDETVYTSRYGPQNLEITNVLEGIKNYVGKSANVEYALGCEVVDATWPESEIIPTPLTADEQKQIADAVAKAKQSDMVIAVVGQDEKRCGESKSRTGLGLPGRQFQLLQALKETEKPIVVILINGQPLTINWENRYIPAILEAWFPNAKGGTAIAETIFGDYNPGGKLPVTFPKSIGQIELNIPFKPGSHAGQPTKGPNGYGNTSVVGSLYPFGHGLSYTTFEYTNLLVSPKIGKTQKQIKISVDITNIGNRKGDEVVQLYIKDKVSSVTVYETQLRGFERITLEPGQTETVHFTLKPEDLQLLDKNMNWTVEPGAFEVLIGSSSENIRQVESFTLTSNVVHVETDVYLLMGQSNMAGRGVIDSIANTYLSDQVLMLTKNNTIVPAHHPLHFDKPKIAGVGPGIMFGSELSRETRNQILLVPCAVGGTSIKSWSPGVPDEITNTYPYDDAIQRLGVAMKSGELKGVIWHQGEADRRSEEYLDDLVEFIQRIRAFTGDDDLPFVVGELGYFLQDVEVFNNNLQKLYERINNVAVVSAKGLNHKGDGVHFSSRSAEILGKRYAEAIKELQQ